MNDVGQLIEDAKTICAIPAPTFHEAQRARYVKDRLDGDIDDAGNVLRRFGPADSDAPALVFAAHLDTVFDKEQPIVIKHEADRIHAPGIGDNSLAVAALLALARDFEANPPNAPVVLAATVGEEGLGDLRGAKHLLDTLPCRAFVAVEGAMLDSIKHAGVGSIRYRVTFRGPGGHSWADRGAPSALHGLIEVATRFLVEPAPPGVARNLGILHGGTTINTIAAQATLELDLRAEAPEPLTRTAEHAKEVFENAPTGLTADMELIGERPSGGIPADHPLVQAARDARTKAGLEPAKEGASSTDANAAYARGIPAITVGLTTGGNGHRTDEYIDLAPLSAGMQALLRLARHLTQAP